MLTGATCERSANSFKCTGSAARKVIPFGAGLRSAFPDTSRPPSAVPSISGMARSRCVPSCVPGRIKTSPVPAPGAIRILLAPLPADAGKVTATVMPGIPAFENAVWMVLTIAAAVAPSVPTTTVDRSTST